MQVDQHSPSPARAATLAAALLLVLLTLGCQDPEGDASGADAGATSADTAAGALSDAPSDAADVVASDAADDAADDAGGVQDAGPEDGDADAPDSAADATSADLGGAPDTPEEVAGDTADLGDAPDTVDAGSNDAASTDVAPIDTAVLDAATADGSAVDATPTDAAPADGSPSDGTSADTVAGDIAASDASAGDVTTGDATTSDTATGDTSQSDAGAAVNADVGPKLSKPTDPKTLPLAGFTDATGAFGVDPNLGLGRCIGVADLDDDGDQDVVLMHIAGQKAAIHALLLGGAKVQTVVSPFDTTALLPTHGCAVADFDADGKPDLLAGGPSGAALYLGDGKGGFKDASNAWLPWLMDFSVTSFAVADFDGDGDLDVVVGAGTDSVPPCNTMSCAFTATDYICKLDPKPQHKASKQDRILIQGAKLPMVDATTTWAVPKSGNYTHVMPVDLDADGKMDVIIADDFGGQRWLRNKGGAFVTHIADAGLEPYANAMGWAVGDWNSDGKPDLILADWGPPPAYTQGPGKGGVPVGMVEQANALGLAGPLWGSFSWAPVVGDFDLDGRDDIAVATSANWDPAKAFKSFVDCSLFAGTPSATMLNPAIDIVFLARPQGGFASLKVVQAQWSGIDAVNQMLVDLDGDGDLDIVQVRPGPKFGEELRPRLLRNDLTKKGGWAVVRVKGKGKNTGALGAVVRAKVGGALRTRWLLGSGGFGGPSQGVAHFGLGAAKVATDVSVTWPDGKVSKLPDLKAGTTTLATWP